MSYISFRDAVLFMSQSAPPAWAYRSLLWMASTNELNLYADKVEVTPYTSVGSFTMQLYEKAGEFSGEKMDLAIRAEYPPEMAAKLVGRSHGADFFDETLIVSDPDQLGVIDRGFILFADEIDWQNSRMSVGWIDEKLISLEELFPTQGFVGSEIEDPNYQVVFEGLKFEANVVELLLPSAQLVLPNSSSSPTPGARYAGRPTKWDWDGAMAHVIAMANSPDGLPDGHGAQAKIEAMIAQWFVDQTGNSPATSQIRAKASRIMRGIEKD
jgi:hypothetical protein